MNYQVLARKWRPRSFAEMVGQGHVLKALINALNQQRLHHAYLFTGTRGVGKTTLARIIAKCLNCEQGVSATPCGKCSACRSIDEGRFVDLIEVDAASRTKVEDTRELLDNVQYAPTLGRYKVYLIDEVHMLSTHSFNALLKTLEEPPPHVKFLLATTDPQKLPITVLSRCLQFALKSLSPERLVQHLSIVLTAEQVPFEPEALWLLGRAADGSVRDALTLTDQAIAYGEGKISVADVQAMLGTLDHGLIFDLLQALTQGNAQAVFQHIQHLAELGPDWPTVLAELLNLLHRVAIAQTVPEALDNSQGDQSRVVALAQSLSGEDVQFYYQLGLIGRRDLPLAPDLRSGFEMVLLRMLAFRPVSMPSLPVPATPLLTETEPRGPIAEVSTLVEPETIAAVPTDTDVSLQTSTADQTEFSVVKEIETAEPIAAVIPSEQEFPTPIDEAPVIASDSDFEDNYFREEDTEDSFDYPTPEPSLEPPTNALQSDNIPELEPAVEQERPLATGLAADWIQLLPQLGLSGLTLSIASHCTLVAREDNRWCLHLDPRQSALFNSTQQERLNNALNAYYGKTITLEMQVCLPQQETPAQANARIQRERQRQAKESLLTDPVVQQLMSRFSAIIREHSIKPLPH